MKNYEKYKDEIKKCDGSNFCRDFVKPHILKSRSCANTSCDQCKMLQIIWLMEEYEEPEVDWSKIPVDTLVRVREREDKEWILRYFKGINEDSLRHRYEAWESGATSKTAKGKYWCWNYCELVEDEDDGCN